jgi:hypothetical protein
MQIFGNYFALMGASAGSMFLPQPFAAKGWVAHVKVVQMTVRNFSGGGCLESGGCVRRALVRAEG